MIRIFLHVSINGLTLVTIYDSVLNFIFICSMFFIDALNVITLCSSLLLCDNSEQKGGALLVIVFLSILLIILFNIQ